MADRQPDPLSSENGYSVPPSDWRSLQHKVYTIFRDIGFDVEIQKTVQTARGTVEVDVLAERHEPIGTVILSECKYWNKPVPKAVVHGFSKVVQDYGANLGYIISKAGFNAGAYDAAKFTNIRLLTWEEFKATFELEWLKGISGRVSEDFRVLMDCTEPVIASWVVRMLDTVDEGEVSHFKGLREKFAEIGSLVATIAVFEHTKDLFGMKFPFEFAIGSTRLTVASSWELIDVIYADGTKAQDALRRVLNSRSTR